MSSLSLVRRRGVVIAVLGALLAGLLLLVPTAGAPAADPTGKVRGNIFGKAGGAPLKLKMLIFKADWTYLSARNVFGSAYSISLPEGNYHLQFVDKRPSYDVSKFAPTDVFVKVRSGSTSSQDVRMRKGAAITGTVFAGGKPGAKARVVAANPNEQSFETVANDKGQFAIGGLPAASYSVFTYDRRKQFVGKSSYIRNLGAGKFANVRISLPKKAGGLLVDLYAGGKPLQGTTFATAISRRTGQFWTSKVRKGSVTFQGLFPGRYRIVVPDVGRWIGRTGSVKNGVVRPGRTAFGSFKLTQKGGAFTGRIVREDGGMPMGGATVRLFDKSGAMVSETATSSTGYFLVGGKLRAQSGMTLVAFNSFDANYDRISLEGLSIQLNQDKSLGTLVMPRAEASARR